MLSLPRSLRGSARIEIHFKMRARRSEKCVYFSRGVSQGADAGVGMGQSERQNERNRKAGRREGLKMNYLGFPRPFKAVP
jgi:hypothetical protein